MPKPRIVIDPLPRTMEMIFDADTRRRLEALGNLVVFEPAPGNEAEIEALTNSIESGRIKAAIDVFPQEPLAANHRIRNLSNVLLSAHRAGGIKEAFLEIGRLVVSDLELVLRGLPPVSCRLAQPETIGRLRGMPVQKS
ncbi:MAG: NAD(P)-dependent oxidoreductase [Chthoniobacterales bacterium]